MNLKPNCISRGPERTLEAEKGFWKSERDETDTTRLPAAHLPSTILQLPVPLKSVVREAIEVDAVEQVESLPPREKRLRSPFEGPSVSQRHDGTGHEAVARLAQAVVSDFVKGEFPDRRSHKLLAAVDSGAPFLEIRVEGIDLLADGTLPNEIV